MYTALRNSLANLLRVPTTPPEVPSGTYGAVEIMRASPRYLTYSLLGFYLGAAITFVVEAVALVSVFVSGDVWAQVLTVPVLLLLALGLFLKWFLVRIDYDLRYYVVTDRSLRVREGAWTVAEMTLTYANVQNVRIEQGPLQRLFGISDLVVDTAGGGAVAHPKHSAGVAHHVRLAGLEDAAAVRDKVLSYVRQHGRTSGLGDLDDAERPTAAARLAPEVLAAARELREESRRFRQAAEQAR